MIFVLIAGTYTPVALLALQGARWRTAILIVVWAGAVGGVVFKLVWLDAPEVAVRARLRRAGLGVAGRHRRAARSRSAGWGVAGLTAGDAVHRRRGRIPSGRPDPSPLRVRYHEVFHALVLAAAGLHYAVIAFAVLRRL